MPRLNAANANVPKGALSDAQPDLASSQTTTSFSMPSEYAPLIIAYHNGAPVRLSDVATVVDGSPNTATRAR